VRRSRYPVVKFFGKDSPLRRSRLSSLVLSEKFRRKEDLCACDRRRRIALCAISRNEREDRIQSLAIRKMPTRRVKDGSKAGKVQQKGNNRRHGGANKQDDGVHDIFHEMLAEVEPSSSRTDEVRSSPLKRRKLTKDGSPLSNTQSAKQSSPRNKSSASKRSVSAISESKMNVEPAAEDGFEHLNQTERSEIHKEPSDGSDESELEWEEVELQRDEDSESSSETGKAPLQDLDIVLGEQPTVKSDIVRMRRKGVTLLERKRRLDIHKMHVLCLLYHSYVRNKWCNDGEVQVS
jgi:hypothetical protein